MLRLPQLQSQNKIDGSIGFRTTQSVLKCMFYSFILKKNYYIIFLTQHKFFLKKIQLYQFKKIKINKYYLDTLLDTHFIPLQIEASPILVGPKLGEPQAFECQNTSLFRRAVVKGKIFYSQEPPSGESTTTECGINYQLLAAIY